jgi:hypothetical protein
MAAAPALLLIAHTVFAAARTPETKPAVLEMTAEERTAARALFGRMRDAFVAQDAAACLALVGPGVPERDRIRRNLEAEFRRWRYVAFEITEILPDDRLSPRLCSVDVHLRYEILDATRPADKQEPVKNGTVCSFVLERQDDGSFAVRRSPFFDTLGQRLGLGNFAEILLAAIAVFALLGFWIWMGFEALRARPRNRLWRAAVLLAPVAGAGVYFLAVYLPRWRQGASAASRSRTG